MKQWMVKITAVLGLGMLLPLTAPAISPPTAIPATTAEQAAYAYDVGSVRVGSDKVLPGLESSQQPVPSFGLLAKLVAAKSETTVIGRVKDLQNLGPGEKSLLDRLPDLGSPKANWEQNSGVLRQEMNRGLPIRDASPGDTAGQFLNAERNLLRDRGWTLDPKTSTWMPPQ